MINLIDTTEFNKRYKTGDIVCHVAVALAKSAFMSVDLRLSNKYIIHKYMDKARELISKFEENNLEIKLKE